MSISDLQTMINVVLVVVVPILGVVAHSNNRERKIALGVAAAYHAADSAAYNADGTINKARVDFAAQVIAHLLPKANPAVIQADIIDIVGVIHQHAAEVQAAAAA